MIFLLIYFIENKQKNKIKTKKKKKMKDLINILEKILRKDHLTNEDVKNLFIYYRKCLPLYNNIKELLTFIVDYDTTIIGRNEIFDFFLCFDKEIDYDDFYQTLYEDNEYITNDVRKMRNELQKSERCFNRIML